MTCSFASGVAYSRLQGMSRFAWFRTDMSLARRTRSSGLWEVPMRVQLSHLAEDVEGYNFTIGIYCIA